MQTTDITKVVNHWHVVAIGGNLDADVHRIVKIHESAGRRHIDGENGVEIKWEHDGMNMRNGREEVEKKTD